MKVNIKPIHIGTLILIIFIVGVWIGVYLNETYPVTTSEELSYTGTYTYTAYHGFFGSSLFFGYVLTFIAILMALFLIAISIMEE